MTLINGISPSEQDFADNRNMFSRLETLLQTNNDLVLAIHKAFVEQTTDVNRKIDNLRDDMREMRRVFLQSQQEGVSEEASKWRAFTEALLAKQVEQHGQDMTRLVELFKLMSTMPPATANTPAVTANKVPPVETKPALVQPIVVPSGVAQPAAPPVTTAPPSQQLQLLPSSTSSITTIVPPVSKPAFGITPFGIGANKPPGVFSGFGSSQAVNTQQSIAKAVPVPTNAPAVTAKVSPVETKPALVQPIVVPSGVAQPAAPPVTTAPPSQQLQLLPNSTSSITTIVPPVSKPAFGISPFGTGANKPPGVFPGFGSSPAMNTQQPVAKTVAVPTAPLEKPSLFGGGLNSGGGCSPFSNNGTAFTNNPAGGLTFDSFQTPKSNDSNFLAQKPAANVFGNPKDHMLFQQPQQQVEKEKPRKDGGSDAESGDEFVPDAHFEPVIPLPSLVEVKTGEEEEDVLLATRCKLYRYDSETKENKERGLGEIKILQNRATGRYRCVMRRDQVLKICANFPIHSNFNITQRQNLPNVYQWHCKDYSDDAANGVDSVLIAKFKEASVAKQFADKIAEVVNDQ